MINSITSILWDGFASITFVIVFHISNIFRFSKAFCLPLSVYVWGLISFKMCLKGNLQDPWHTGQTPSPPQISIFINGYMYLSKLSHVSVKSQGQSAGSMAHRPDPIPSPQQYHPAKGQHPVEHVRTTVNLNKSNKFSWILIEKTTWRTGLQVSPACLPSRNQELSSCWTLFHCLRTAGYHRDQDIGHD